MGLAHIGEQKNACGRSGEAPSNTLGAQLRTLGSAMDAAEDRHSAAVGWPDD